MSSLEFITVDARIVLASNRLRLRDLLRLERGSVVPLSGDADTLSALHVNGVAVALGQIIIADERTSFAVSNLLGEG